MTSLQVCLRQIAERARSVTNWDVEIEEPSAVWLTARVTVSLEDQFITIFEDNDELCFVSNSRHHATPVPFQGLDEVIGFIENMVG